MLSGIPMDRRRRPARNPTYRWWTWLVLCAAWFVVGVVVGVLLAP